MTSPTHLHETLRAGLFMVAASAAFVTNDTCVKLLAGQLPVGEIVAIRGAFATILIGVICWHQRVLVSLPGIASRHVLSRAVLDLIGTLAFITEATLRLRPAPPPRSTLIAFFPSLEDAGRAVVAIPRAGLGPVTLELMDRFTIAAVDDEHNLGLDRQAEAMLLIESDLPGAAATSEVDRAGAACEAEGATSVIRAANAQEADWLRQARRMAYYSLERLGVTRMEDVVVPRARVPELLREIEALTQRLGVRCGTFGHAGDGNLHPNFVFDRDDPTAEETYARVQPELYRAAMRLGGSITGEHGVGLAKRAYLEEQRGPDAVRLMHAIKGALDPQGIINPGKVLP